jgi:cellulose synthase/poly-beta-1,6-N-acetylglucosamine synthase-like glycosyltransferase
MAALLVAMIAVIMPFSTQSAPTGDLPLQQLTVANAMPNNPDDTVSGLTDVTANDMAKVNSLFVETDAASVNLRARPGLDTYVFGTVKAGESLEVVEPYDSVVQKIGKAGEWLKIRTEDGTEGYTAAWLYTMDEGKIVSIEKQATTIPVVTERNNNLLGESSLPGLYLVPTGNNIRIRKAPVDGEILGMVALGEVVEVIGKDPMTADKIGVQEEWIQIRTEDGIEGYTAAWLYKMYDGVLPSWVTLPETPMVSSLTGDSIIPPLTENASDNGLLAETLNATINVPVDNTVISSETVSSGNTVNIDALLFGEPSPTTSILPLSDSIGALNIPDSARNASSTADTPDAVGNVETTDNSAVTLDSSLTDLSTQLTSDIVPITIAVAEDVDFQSAELAINGHKLVSFDEPPFTYDLDTTRLSAGNYILTFAVINSEGVASISGMDFEVATVNKLPNFGGTVDSESAATTSSSVGDPSIKNEPQLGDGGVLPSGSGLNFLLINGERQPFDLSFTLDGGLQPIGVEQSAIAANSEETLGDILTKPANLIPEPIKNVLAAQHPVFSVIVVILMTVILLPQGLFTLYWMTYTWNDPKAAEKYRSPKEYAPPEYSFTAILPARHEAGVIKDTIKAVDRIDYPDHLKEILVMIRDEDDDDTISQAQETINELGKDNIRLITFTDGPRNKPNGLNRGLKAATNQVVCIFDAEDEPHPEIYNVVNTVILRDEVDVVQSGVQLINFESNWFSALNCLEYFFWFRSGLHAFTHKFNVTPLGGNTVFFKKHWLERAGGWDEACLTEDGDIGIRLTQLGAKMQIVYDEKHATQEETPHNMENFIKQRTRWVQGFYQIFLKGDWMKLPQLKQKVTALYILLNSLLQASIVFFIPVGLYIALTQEIPVLLALLSYLPIFLLLIQMIINLVGIREFTEAYDKKLPFLFTLKMILVYYPYQLLLSFAAIRAVWRMLAQNTGWEKTSHSNLHRQTSIPGHLAQEAA